MVDCVIVGGGVYGVATAWELASRGMSVRVLESRTVAGAASGGPGRRGVRASMRDPRELPLMVEAYRRWPTLESELGFPAPYQQTGSLTLIERGQDLESAAARVRVQNGLGIDSRLLDRDALREAEPAVDDRVRAAIHCPGDGVAAHEITTLSFAAAAKRAGVDVDEQTAVESFERNGSRVTAVFAADGERIAVDRACLLLANAGVAGLLESEFGLELPVWNTALQVLVTQPRSTIAIRHLIGHASRTLAVKMEQAGRVMVSGGYRARWHAGEHRGETLPEAVRENLAQAAAVFPALEGAEVLTADANHLEAMCVDGIPIIDRLDAASNLFYATGWCGHGWAIAPVVSRLLSNWVLSGDRPELLQPFSAARFATAR